MSIVFKQGYEIIYEHMKKALIFFIGLHVFINPFPQLTAIEEISFYGAVALFFILFIMKKVPLHLSTPFTVPFALFTLWSVVGIFFAVNKPNTIHDIYAHLLKYLLLYYLLVNIFSRGEHLETLRKLIVLSTTIFSLYLIVYYYFILGNPISRQLGYAMPWEIPSNFIPVLTIFAFLLSLNSFILTTYWQKKALFALCTAVTLITTLLAQTRSAVLALMIALVCCFINSRTVLVSFLLSVFLLIFILPIGGRFSPENLAEKLRKDDRIQIWSTFWEMLKDHPLTGVGFGMQTYHDEEMLHIYNQRVASPYRQPVVHKSPHNFFVDTAVRTGFVGLSIFLVILFGAFRTAIEGVKRSNNENEKRWFLCMIAALGAWIVQGFFESIISGPTAKVFFLIMAMITILSDLQSGTVGRIASHNAS